MSQHWSLSDARNYQVKDGEEAKAETQESLERKEGRQERINSAKIINSFPIEMLELCKVLEYAKFYSFVTEIISIIHTEQCAKIAQM